VSSPSPVAWEALEDAVHDWIKGATGLPGQSVYFLEPRESGAWEPPPPAAQIQVLTFVAVGQAEVRRIPQVMHKRLAVRAGAGEVGIDFYLGKSRIPTRVSVIAEAEDEPAATAAALLAQLSSLLPAGVTASAGSPTTIDVVGTTAQPLFAVLPVLSSRLTVTTVFERWANLRCKWSRMTWRVLFRANSHRGFASAMALATKSELAVRRLLGPNVHAAGWRYAGTLATTQVPSQDRRESSAALDFAIEGYATEATQAAALRLVGVETAIT
jgi:hypothetical protein